MSRVFNFSAGPAAIPQPVLERARAELLDWNGTGASVMELIRELHAEGTTLNQLAFPINPNLFTINCLTEWSFDGITGYGEDHDNWAAASIRRFMRDFLKLNG